MAFKQVVVDRFFGKMMEYLEQLRDDRGALTLAMLDLTYRTGPAHWNLSLAAPWLDQMNLLEATLLIGKSAKEGLGELAIQYSVTRILRTDDYLVRTLVPIFDVPDLGTPYKIDALELSLFNLDEVVVFVADPAQLPVSSQRISA